MLCLPARDCLRSEHAIFRIPLITEALPDDSYARLLWIVNSKKCNQTVCSILPFIKAFDARLGKAGLGKRRDVDLYRHAFETQHTIFRRSQNGRAIVRCDWWRTIRSHAHKLWRQHICQRQQAKLVGR